MDPHSLSIPSSFKGPHGVVKVAVTTENRRERSNNVTNTLGRGLEKAKRFDFKIPVIFGLEVRECVSVTFEGSSSRDRSTGPPGRFGAVTRSVLL